MCLRRQGPENCITRKGESFNIIILFIQIGSKTYRSSLSLFNLTRFIKVYHLLGENTNYMYLGKCGLNTIYTSFTTFLYKLLKGPDLAITKTYALNKIICCNFVSYNLTVTYNMKTLQIGDKTYCQLQSLLSDPVIRDSHQALLQLVSTLGRVVNHCEVWFRDDGKHHLLTYVHSQQN